MKTTAISNDRCDYRVSEFKDMFANLKEKYPIVIQEEQSFIIGVLMQTAFQWTTRAEVESTIELIENYLMNRRTSNAS